MIVLIVLERAEYSFEYIQNSCTVLIVLIVLERNRFL